MSIRLLGCEAFRLLIAHGPWSLNLVDFQQHLLCSLCPHITVPLAFLKVAHMRSYITLSRFVRAESTVQPKANPKTIHGKSETPWIINGDAMHREYT